MGVWRWLGVHVIAMLTAFVVLPAPPPLPLYHSTALQACLEAPPRHCIDLHGRGIPHQPECVCCSPSAHCRRCVLCSFAQTCSEYSRYSDVHTCHGCTRDAYGMQDMLRYCRSHRQARLPHALHRLCGHARKQKKKPPRRATPPGATRAPPANSPHPPRRPASQAQPPPPSSPAAAPGSGAAAAARQRAARAAGTPPPCGTAP